MSKPSYWRIALVASAMLLGAAQGFAQSAPPPPVASPEIFANGDVMLRIRAPNAAHVRVVSGGDIPSLPFNGGLDLAKNGEGVWEGKLAAQPSGAYRYRFEVDGVPTIDPSNASVSQSNGNAWSLYYVPGTAFMDTQRVPHGALAEVNYFSTVLGRDRRMHVYTPPGYELSDTRYPVFYLLHGAGDSDDSWSTVGRAGFILDNLIASGAAEPMVVVMPAGHTGPFTFGAGGFGSEFVREFATDIKPHVEASYRVRTGRGDTALAGLSMGGAQTLDIAIADLEQYGYVGVFSSGIFDIREGTAWADEHAAVLEDASQREGLELVWFATGRDDFLLDVTKATVGMLEQHGFDVTYEETGGGHTWIVWREYLHAFAPKLFK